MSLTRLFYILPLLMVLAVGCKKTPPPPPPPEVMVVTVTPTNVPVYEEWIGTLDGFVNAQIRAQVTGYLQTQNYAEGSRVQKGDKLFKIDPRPFQAVLDQALSRLAQDQAAAHKAKLDVDRYTPLAKEQAISQETLDDAVQAQLGADAQVKADDAAVESARLNLGFTDIISPVDGVAGLATAQIGDLVGQTANALTTVSTIDPVRVYFQVSEQSYLNFWRRFIDDSNLIDQSPLQLILTDGSTYSRPGKFFFADRQVNPNTGTLQVAGLFPNPDLVLRPGQYGRVRAQTHVLTNALVVPQRAVAELQGGYQVTVVTEVGGTNTAHLISVTVGDRVGPNWIIASGLNPGDRVIAEGLQKAKEGAVVNPKPYMTGTNQPAASQPVLGGTNSDSSASNTNK